jgi:hypothetical protein
MKNIFEVLTNKKNTIKVEVPKKTIQNPSLAQIKDILLIKVLSGGATRK